MYPLHFFGSENLFADCIRGCFVVACTLCAFISLVWLREQIVMNGGPDWLEPNVVDPVPQVQGVSWYFLFVFAYSMVEKNSVRTLNVLTTWLQEIFLEQVIITACYMIRTKLCFNFGVKINGKISFNFASV